LAVLGFELRVSCLPRKVFYNLSNTPSRNCQVLRVRALTEEDESKLSITRSPMKDTVTVNNKREHRKRDEDTEDQCR
jgi:hypothetical protein